MSFELIYKDLNPIDMSSEKNVYFKSDIVIYHYYINYIILSTIETNIICFRNYDKNIIIKTSIKILLLMFKKNFVFLSKMNLSNKEILLNYLIDFQTKIETNKRIEESEFYDFLFSISFYVNDNYRNEIFLFEYLMDIYNTNRYSTNEELNYIDLHLYYLIELIKTSKENLDYLIENEMTDRIINGGNYIIDIFELSKNYYFEILNFGNIDKIENKDDIDDIIELYTIQSELYTNFGCRIEDFQKNKIPYMKIHQSLNYLYDNLERMDTINFKDEKTKKIYDHMKIIQLYVKTYSTNYEVTQIYNQLIKIFNQILSLKKIDNNIYFLTKIRIKTVKTIIENTHFHF